MLSSSLHLIFLRRVLRCAPRAAVFASYTDDAPHRVVIGAGEVSLPALEQAVETMREGERALVTIHPRVAYGDAGDVAAGVPPKSFLQYEIHLRRVYEVRPPRISTDALFGPPASSHALLVCAPRREQHPT